MVGRRWDGDSLVGDVTSFVRIREFRRALNLIERRSRFAVGESSRMGGMLP